MNTVRLLSIASLLCLTAIFGCYSQRITGVNNRGSVCHVNLRTNGLPSLVKAMNTLEALEKALPDGCPAASKIKPAFFYGESGHPFLTVERSRGKYWFFFEGKYLPRERWGEDERWEKSNCAIEEDNVKEVTCASRVTAEGEIQFDRIWGRPTQFGSGP